MKKIILLLVLLAFVITGCAFNASAGNSPTDCSAAHAAAGGEEMKPLKITINGQKFAAELYDNEAAQKFMQLLPLSLTMKELNSNEKYCFSAMTAWLCFIKALIPVIVIPELAE